MSLLLSWFACSGPAPEEDPTRSEAPTGDTSTETPPFEASCRLAEDNALRVWCTATLAAPSSLRVELAEVAAPDQVQTFLSEAPASEHRVFAWGLVASTAYTWTVIDERTGASVQGELVTGALPPEFEALTIKTEETAASDVDAVLIAPACPGGLFVMLDRFGRIIWYQRQVDLDPEMLGSINVATWTEDRTIVAVIGRTHLLEFDLTGQILMRSRRGEDFDGYLHHDVFKRNGYIYALSAYAEDIDDLTLVVDGVYVFDQAGTVVDEISLAGLWPVVVQPLMVGGYWGSLFADAVDFTHVNSVYVEPGGDVWLSFRHLHAFAMFRGGPGQPGFGELLWSAVGNQDSAILGAADFTAEGTEQFEGQHDVHPTEDGTILLLDNQLAPGSFARGARYSLDKVEGTLSLVERWNLGMWCPIQGSIRELPGGHVLLSCATAGRMREYAGGALVWETSALCHNVLPASFPRAIPIER